MNSIEISNNLPSLDTETDSSIIETETKVLRPKSSEKTASGTYFINLFV